MMGDTVIRISKAERTLATLLTAGDAVFSPLLAGGDRL